MITVSITDEQLARAAKELNIPYIASGGIADGRGLASALALGAAVRPLPSPILRTLLGIDTYRMV